MEPASKKRRNGQYFTKKNPFECKAFFDWSNCCSIRNQTILEPFAGANSLIVHLQKMGLCRDFSAYDIEPSSKEVKTKDTLRSFPVGYPVCVTNPPWLAKNSATLRGYDFPVCDHDDVYKFSLEKCLEHCDWVAALVPESFVCANLFHDRLTDFVSIRSGLFTDTGHPVGLALFGKGKSDEVRLWIGDRYIDTLESLEAMRPNLLPDGPKIKFNEENGNVGLIALDNTQEASIRYCPVEELSDYKVRHTGRHITKLRVEGDINVERWNQYINEFRQKTSDFLMTCYKGIRKDGNYRRRLDWKLARGIVHHA